jgi:outer membrane protein assembly factor BamB
MHVRVLSFFLFITILTAPFLQADRLVLVSASYGKNLLAITEANGDVVWSHKTGGKEKGHAGHHDVHMLPNGNILFHETWQDVKEITLGKKIVMDYDSGTANGNQGRGASVHAFSRLANGHTQIVESGVGRVIDIDSTGKLMHSFNLKPGGTMNSRWARATPQGTLLVCSEQPGVVTEYNRKGEVVWDYLIKTRVYGAMRLKNGNTLIASGSGKSVVEVTPEKKVVWEIKGKVPGTDINLHWMTCLQERDNGNFIVGNCHAGPDNPQIFEITREKKVVWEYNEFELVGNGLACWQVLDGKAATRLRKQIDALK